MSRTPSTVGLVVLTLLSVLLVAAGGVIAFRPALLLESVPELQPLLAAADPETVVFAFVILLVLFAPTVGIAGRLRPSPSEPLVSDEPETPHDGRFDDLERSRSERQAVVGEPIDEQIALATAYDDEPRDIREAARQRLLESLRPIAAEAYANRAGIPADEAMAAIEDGSWTADRRARAFLAGPAGPSTPLWLWLIDLVSSADPFGRHLEATLEEIERLQSSVTVSRPGTDDETDDATTGATAEVSA